MCVLIFTSFSANFKISRIQIYFLLIIFTYQIKPNHFKAGNAQNVEFFFKSWKFLLNIFRLASNVRWDDENKQNLDSRMFQILHLLVSFVLIVRPWWIRSREYNQYSREMNLFGIYRDEFCISSGRGHKTNGFTFYFRIFGGDGILKKNQEKYVKLDRHIANHICP